MQATTEHTESANISLHGAFDQLTRGLNGRISDYLDSINIDDICYLCILYVHEHRGCLVSTLAAALRMDKAVVTRRLSALGRMGLIERQISKTDSRAFVLSLSAAGRAVLRAIRSICDQWDQELRDSLSGDEYTELCRLLQKARIGMLENQARGAAEAASKQTGIPMRY